MYFEWTLSTKVKLGNTNSADPGDPYITHSGNGMDSPPSETHHCRKPTDNRADWIYRVKVKQGKAKVLSVLAKNTNTHTDKEIKSVFHIDPSLMYT